MARRTARPIVSPLLALLISCSNGGQTYDDGSDGITKTQGGEPLPTARPPEDRDAGLGASQDAVAPRPAEDAEGAEGAEGAERPDGGSDLTPSTDIKCFGPSVNLQHAYDGTIEGCACGDVGDACLGGVALICSAESNTDVGQWLAVEDGPCEPRRDPGVCDGLLMDADSCVRYFDLCVEQQDETLCGTGARTPQCAGGTLVRSPAQCLDDTPCEQIEDGVYCTGRNPVDAPLLDAGSTNTTDAGAVDAAVVSSDATAGETIEGECRRYCGEVADCNDGVSVEDCMPPCIASDGCLATQIGGIDEEGCASIMNTYREFDPVNGCTD